MKILITGGNGVIGKFLANKLKDHEVYNPTRQSVDFTNREHVDKFFASHSRFDLVLHCAAVGGSRLHKDSEDVLDDNLKMYYNILHHKNSYDKFITFGSGAEMHASNTPYGLSKKVIAQSIMGNYNFYNIRIFGLFGEGELETRFIRSALTNYINKTPITIHNNKFMDFFYMEDLWTLVKYYIDTQYPPKVVDCVYTNHKMSLNGMANYVNELGDHIVEIIRTRDVRHLFPEKYVGSEKTLQSLPIELIGFKEGLKIEYEKYKLRN